MGQGYWAGKHTGEGGEHCLERWLCFLLDGMMLDMI